MLKNNSKSPKELILSTLKEKSITKQKVFNNAYNAFRLFRRNLDELVVDYNKDMKEDNVFEIKHRGRFQSDLKIGTDVLIFTLNPNIFEFHRSHPIWKLSYVQNDPMGSYAGLINIYNFLFDSVRFNRSEDLGYLIGRVFINKDNYYLVEGKRQLGFLYNDFGNSIIEKDSVKNIINSAILYSLDFELLVPPYNEVKIATVGQLQERFNTNQMRIGKRLGFKFYADDSEIDM